MLDTLTGEGFYAGLDAEGRVIPTAEARMSMLAHYSTQGIPFTPPKWWNNPVVHRFKTRAFDAAFGDRDARLRTRRRKKGFEESDHADETFARGQRVLGGDTPERRPRHGANVRARLRDSRELSELEEFEIAAFGTCGGCFGGRR